MVDATVHAASYVIMSMLVCMFAVECGLSEDKPWTNERGPPSREAAVPCDFGEAG